jgi:hypothetical protein
MKYFAISFCKLLIFILVYIYLSSELLSQGYLVYSKDNANNSLEYQKISYFLSKNPKLRKKDRLTTEEENVLDYLHLYAVHAPELKGSDSFLHSILSTTPSSNSRIIRKTLEIAVTAFPNRFTSQIIKLAKETSDYRILFLSALYLKESEEYPEFLIHKLNRFSNKYNELFFEKPSVKLPPIDDLLEIQKNIKEWIIFAFRDKTSGFLIIRDPENKFVSKKGNILKIPFMAKSVLQLPFYAAMGDTPQGVYRILGTAKSSNPRIGPTPVVRLGLPIEISVQAFFPEAVQTEWSAGMIQNFFPKSWEGYDRIFQTYHAGWNGRTGIWAHGSTLDPEKFRNVTGSKIHTLTYGCLALPEVWEEGSLKQSDQRTLVSIVGDGKGYLVLFDLKGKEWEELEDSLKTKKAP